MSPSFKLTSNTRHLATGIRSTLYIVVLFVVILYSSVSHALAPVAPVIDLRPANPEPSTEEKSPAPQVASPAVVKSEPSNTKVEASGKSASVQSPTPQTGSQFTTATKKNSPSFKSTQACTNGTLEQRQKNLVTTAFKRALPSQANAGQLYQIDSLFPQMISYQLFNLHAIVEPAFIAESLPTTHQYNQHQIAEINQKLARDQHSQLILTGEIVDMSMAHPNETYTPSLYHRLLNDFMDLIEVKNRFEKRDRLFHFRVQLMDGITGESLYSQDYRTYGLWTLTGEVRFGSEKFWQTDYGKQVAGVTKRAAKDLADVIQCQPLKSTVEARPGQTQIVLQSGANNGLRVGDTLSLYQVVMLPSETAYQQSEKRLLNRNTTVEIREIYPSHSIAMVKGTTYLSGEFLAVAQ